MTADEGARRRWTRGEGRARLGAVGACLVAVGCADTAHVGVAMQSMQSGRIGGEDLQPAPINAAWIIAGRPQARARTLTVTADTNFSSTVWDCTAGTFRWRFGSDEFVHILDGEVTVREDAGGARTLRPGDVALFPQGTTNVWHVARYVRKLAVHRSEAASLPDRVARKLGLRR